MSNIKEGEFSKKAFDNMWSKQTKGTMKVKQKCYNSSIFMLHIGSKEKKFKTYNKPQKKHKDRCKIFLYYLL